MIHVYKPKLGNEEIDALSEVVSSGYIGLGPRSDEFERAFADYLGVGHAVGLNSHTAALDLAIQVLDIGPGDEVIVPTISFLSAAHCVVHNGATPVFADVLPDTLAIDPADVARKITPRTQAIVAFHYGGRPCAIDPLRRIAQPRGIKIIEDAADAPGAEYKGAKVGALGDLACFSFYSTKHIAAGDGGAITTNDARLAEHVRQLRWLGVDREHWRRTEGSSRENQRGYLVEEISLKCHMNDLTAAVALVQLGKLPGNIERRAEIARLYARGLKSIREIQLLPMTTGTYKSAWYILPILCDRRDALAAWLAHNGIATELLYTPLHTYRCYGNRPSLPTAERLATRVLALPIHSGLMDVEIFKVVNAVKAFYLKDRPRIAGLENRIEEMADRPKQKTVDPGDPV